MFCCFTFCLRKKHRKKDPERLNINESINDKLIIDADKQIINNEIKKEVYWYNYPIYIPNKNFDDYY